MSQGFALDFRGDRRSADRALWKHLYDISSAEVGGDPILDMRVAWTVRWTERDPVTGHFADSGTYAICATEWNARSLMRDLRKKFIQTRGMSFDVRKIVFPAGRLSKSDRFRGYRHVLSKKRRSALLTYSERQEVLSRDPRARFVKCYVAMPEGVPLGTS